MIDLKKVRDDIEGYKVICKKKGKKIDVEAILAKDDQRKEFQQKIDAMKFQQKELGAKKDFEWAKALKGEIQWREDQYQKIVEELNKLPGVSCIKPKGAFYVFPNITKTGLTSQEFADLMLERAGVALCPGNFFGENGNGYVRLCYANSMENIIKGMKKMKEVLEKRKSEPDY